MLPAEQRFLSSCPLEGKNSMERHSTVSSSRSYIKQNKSTLSRKEENGLSGGQKQPHREGRVGFLRVVAAPPCVLWHLIDKLIDSLRLYNFSPWAQALTHKQSSKTHGRSVGWRWRGGCAVVIHYKYIIMNPGPASTGAGAGALESPLGF